MDGPLGQCMDFEARGFSYIFLKWRFVFLNLHWLDFADGTWKYFIRAPSFLWIKAGDYQCHFDIWRMVQILKAFLNRRNSKGQTFFTSKSPLHIAESFSSSQNIQTFQPTQSPYVFHYIQYFLYFLYKPSIPVAVI